jgi:hypothetical protein
MKNFLNFLAKPLGISRARWLLIWPLVLSILTACGISKTVSPLPDGAPVPHAIQHPAERYEDLSLEKLRALGIDPQVVEAGTNEHGIYVSRSEEIEKAFAAGIIRISFSLWDAQENFVLAIPATADDGRPFIVAEGYQLRISLIPYSVYGGLSPDTIYLVALNPPKAAR